MAPDRVLPPLLAVLARAALEIARDEAHHVPLVLIAGGSRGGELLSEPRGDVLEREAELREDVRKRLANVKGDG